jgi:phage-related baseplate assembly protein
MSAFTQIDLSRLPAPQVVTVPDFEVILAEMKSAVISLEPDLAPVLALESEMATKVLQVCAFYVMLARAEKNDDARAVMLAFATGSDLDHLGALFGVARAVIDPGNPGAVPPVPAVMEDDTRLRARIQLALEGFSTAGPVGAYLFHTLSASPLVRDAFIESPEPGEVRVTVLSTEGDGTPDAALLDVVAAGLNDEEVRPLTDLVVVQAALIEPLTIDAAIEVMPGPDPAMVLAAAQAAIEAWADDLHRLGRSVRLSAIYAALHREGVKRVVLTEPVSDIEIDPDQAAWVSAIALSLISEGA